ncbi:MAG: NAD(P)/FAD-dependent oxidoreductase [Prevotella sp.]|uniref:NAD(P)/FAD-dependent oxidoreductase n=1 Tax=Leyella stercorea TaxID=363265 RepID=UPI00280174DE|nr:NAD(P)/FAD-dependent oxidoreductase [Leyella stercorea]MDY2894152.1 NAD(P)/FAD-dependent oxidoreductase [Prevotella sp.]MDY4197446.1 NAD(P)/FAD-dependent oxidoreductase [Prevotella sp.]MEE0488416.1 NAD(P)/FAD-dependent oxidoreductase [Prevotella sp.]
MSINIQRNQKKRVVIVGGGLGGLRLAEDLYGSGMQVVLIDKNNFHQFPPLIYQIASAGIDPSSISFPFRQIFRKRKDFYFRMAEARMVDTEKKILQTSIGKIDYDYLVLAAGATTNFFGNKNIEEWAIPMKTVPEAMGLRNALLSNFERALTCATEEERQELLNVVIVGGGATGVEIAGALAEMRRYVIPYDYPDMDSSLMHIYLIEAGDRLLAGLSQESSQKAYEFLKSMGVDIQFGKMVTDYRDHKVVMKDGTEIPTRTFLWVSGIRANAMPGIDESHLGRGFRFKVDEYNRIPGLNDVFAIGDQCLQTSDAAYPNGHPQVAQVAIQQAKNLAKNLKLINQGADSSELTAFHYKNLGSMATIGRNKAVVEIGKFRSQGFFAWVLWLVVHLRSILGVKNKMMVLLNWLWKYVSYNDSIRMITYATKPREVEERMKREQTTHLGEDLME